MLEFCFFFWLWGVDDLWSLDTNTLPFKFIMLIVIFLTAEWSMKKSGLKEFIEEEKKKILKSDIDKEINGQLYDILAKLVKSLIGIRIVIPSTFKR